MNEFIEECKVVLAECRENDVSVKVNNVMFSQEFEFDFNDNAEILFIRFRTAGIGSIVASICYDEIKSFE